MVFFTVPPFPVCPLPKRRLLLFLSIVSLLCGAALVLAHSYPRPAVPLAQAPVPSKDQEARIPTSAASSSRLDLK
jgi:hypothetical protein